jgi:hypothetical protein
VLHLVVPVLSVRLFGLDAGEGVDCKGVESVRRREKGENGVQDELMVERLQA